MNNKIKDNLKLVLYVFVIFPFIDKIINYFGITRVAGNLLALFLFFIFWYGFFELAKK